MPDPSLPPLTSPSTGQGQGQMYSGQGSTPVPDPTILTNQAVAQAADMLRRELQAAVDVIQAKISGQQSVFETRLDAMDEAIKLVRLEADQLPNQVDDRVRHLEDLTNVKFDGIKVQFVERDVRTEQTARDAKTAVDAALQAQKEQAGKQAETFSEATRKSEDQFTKQIDLQGELLRTEVKGLVTQIGELKDRFNRGEGVGLGNASAQQGHQIDRGYFAYIMATVIMGVLALAALAVAVLKP